MGMINQILWLVKVGLITTIVVGILVNMRKIIKEDIKELIAEFFVQKLTMLDEIGRERHDQTLN